MPQASEATLSGLYSDPETLYKCVLKTDVMDGVVSNLFPPNSFMFVEGSSGLVQSLIIVDKLVQKLGDTLWRYKINAWNEQNKKLNVEYSRTYHFAQCKLKSCMTSIKSYPGQSEFDVNLSPFSSVVGLAPAIV